MRVRTPMKLGLSVAVAGLMAACGGGSGTLPDATTSQVTTKVEKGSAAVALGTSFVVKGTATSQPNAMKTMVWSVAKLTAGSTDLAVANGDCASGMRTGSSVNGISRSQWACDAVVTAPSALTASSTYRITFTGTDDKGNSSADYREVTVGATATGPAGSPPVASTTPRLVVTAGDDVGLNCLGTGGTLSPGKNFVYSWVVKSNPSGLPLTLNAPGGGALTFKAPSVRSSTDITLQCRVLDDALALGTADTVVTIAQGGAAAAVANAGTTQTVDQKSLVSLDASGSAAAGSPALYYLWQQTAGPTVSLSDAFAAKPSFFAPAVSDTTRLTFRVTAMVTAPADPSRAAPSEVATVSVYVTPEVPLTLSISPSLVAKTGTAVRLQVSATPTSATQPFYYAWTQVFGPTVTIGAANTSTASFIATDIASSDIDSLFTVSVSRKPLNESRPEEIYTADVVVRTTP